MTAFILSLWSAVLSAAGVFGQLYYRWARQPQPWVTDNTQIDAVAMLHPKIVISISFGLFFLPIVISSYLVLRHIRRTGQAEPLLFTALCLNTFSLLYGLFLYGALK